LSAASETCGRQPSFVVGQSVSRLRAGEFYNATLAAFSRRKVNSKKFFSATYLSAFFTKRHLSFALRFFNAIAFSVGRHLFDPMQKQQMLTPF